MPSWSLIQSNSSFTGGAASLTCSYPSPTSPDNLLIATVFASMSTVGSIADQGGNNWNQAVSGGDSPDDPRFADAGYIYYAKCTAHAGTVTITLPELTAAALNIYEFAPPSGSFSALDATTSNSEGNGATNTGSTDPDSGAFFPASGELAFGTIITPGANGETCTAGPGWTPGTNNTAVGILCDMYQTGTGSEADADGTLSVADNWFAAVASFTFTSPPPPPPKPVTVGMVRGGFPSGGNLSGG